MASPLDLLFSAAQFRAAGRVAPHGEAEYADFASRAMPSSMREDWRYTDVATADFSAFAPLDFSFQPGVLAENCEASREASRVAWTASDKFEAGLKAFSHSFLHIAVPQKKKARAQAVFSPKGSVACTNVVEVSEGATLDYYEDYVSDGGRFFFGAKIVFLLSPRSTLNYYPLQRFGDGAFSLSSREFHLADGATANMVAAEMGGGFSRVKAEQHFDGNGASAPVHKTVYFGSGAQRFDLTTNAYHHATKTKSDIVVKGALSGTASSVYRGLIKIDQPASGTDSFLHDRVLHLSRGVKSNSIPSLVIDNNDVRASHGATTSKVSPEALFYLQSRGLPRKAAQRLVVEGFVNDVVSSIPDEVAREKVALVLGQKMAAV